MNSSLFFGGSVIAASIAGVIALFAPCCISVMLPAYFAISFHNRRVLAAMTFLFAAGIATIVLPLTLGVSLVRQVMIAQHTLIYGGGGILMLALSVYLLLGGQLHLPMPGRRSNGGTGAVSVYTLGIFSGITSSCCAPVLAGVIALSSVASSLGLALVLGTAYVFGMVAPLFIIALLWERYNWRASRLFRPRAMTWRLGTRVWTITVTNLASGVLLLFIAAGMIWAAIASDAMAPLSGWQAQMIVTLQHVGQVLTAALAWIPNWVGALLLLLALSALGAYALKQLRRATSPSEGEPSSPEQEQHEGCCVQSEEESSEQESTTR